VLALGLLLGTAAPAQAEIIGIGRATGSGDFASAIAQGDVDEPRALFVRVKSTPSQGIFVSWIVTCTRGNDIRLTDGDYDTTTPDYRQIRIPFRRTPDDCDVTAGGFLDEGGRVTVILYARV